MADVTCARCGETREGLDRAPYPDALGAEIAERICARCWDECRGQQVMVINELRLDLSDPRAQEILETHIRDFLNLSGGSGGAQPGPGGGAPTGSAD